MVETGEGQEVVIDIGGGAGAGERPEEEEAVIDQIEGFGLVAEAVFAMRAGGGWVAEPVVLGALGVGEPE